MTELDRMEAFWHDAEMQDTQEAMRRMRKLSKAEVMALHRHYHPKADARFTKELRKEELIEEIADLVSADLFQ